MEIKSVSFYIITINRKGLSDGQPFFFIPAGNQERSRIRRNMPSATCAASSRKASERPT